MNRYKSVSLSQKAGQVTVESPNSELLGFVNGISQVGSPIFQIHAPQQQPGPAYWKNHLNLLVPVPDVS